MWDSWRAAAAGLAMIAAAQGATPAWAEPVAYPQKIVSLVTHSSPGGGSDVFLRELSRILRKYVNATFVVENVQGGSGARAMARVAAARPDGGTFYATTPTYVFTSLMSKPPSTFHDLEPLVNLFTDAEVVFTRADGPYKTLGDAIAHAREKRGRWGAANPASLERQAAELLKRAAKVNAAVVSHEGGGDMMINVLNGTLEIGVGEIPELRSQLDAGKVRLLATFNAERLPTHPELPTVKELGFDVVVKKFRGLAGPKGLPAEVVAIWDSVVPQMLADPEYQQLYAAGSLVADFIPHRDYTRFIDDFATSSEAFFKEAGMLK